MYHSTSVRGYSTQCSNPRAPFTSPRTPVQCQWLSPFPTGRRRHIMTGGAGRHAAPYLHHLPCALLREGLPADRFSFLCSAGHRQKRWIRSEAGWTRFRAIFSPGPTTDRRRLLSTDWAPKHASRPVSRQSRQGVPGSGPSSQAQRDGHARHRLWDAVVLAHREIVDANRKSFSPASLLFPGINGGEGRQASRTAAILLFGSGRQTQCRCRSPVREEKKREGQCLF